MGIEAKYRELFNEETLFINQSMIQRGFIYQSIYDIMISGSLFAV